MMREFPHCGRGEGREGRDVVGVGMVGLLGVRRGEVGRGAEVVEVEGRGVGGEEEGAGGEGVEEGGWVGAPAIE